jgi:hypothetical protein
VVSTGRRFLHRGTAWVIPGEAVQGGRAAGPILRDPLGAQPVASLSTNPNDRWQQPPGLIERSRVQRSLPRARGSQG